MGGMGVVSRRQSLVGGVRNLGSAESGEEGSTGVFTRDTVTKAVNIDDCGGLTRDITRDKA